MKPEINSEIDFLKYRALPHKLQEAFAWMGTRLLSIEQMKNDISRLEKEVTEEPEIVLSADTCIPKWEREREEFERQILNLMAEFNGDPPAARHAEMLNLQNKVNVLNTLISTHEERRKKTLQAKKERAIIEKKNALLRLKNQLANTEREVEFLWENHLDNKYYGSGVLGSKQEDTVLSSVFGKKVTAGTSEWRTSALKLARRVDEEARKKQREERARSYPKEAVTEAYDSIQEESIQV